ncbi:TenA family transcriptional regulator [Pseudokineococcus sp. 1T1Z-3]|uniref:TenA family transcriptional regulator n=1 Tax=Pseudokineococcus sp. 1T1Z-3 TaxID=3132745 RepID=UPI003095C151
MSASTSTATPPAGGELARHRTSTDGRPFAARVAAQTAGVRAAVDRLPFLAALADGSLEPATFRHYLEQDGCYLKDYARALALLAARAPTPQDAAVWAGSAAGAVAAERDLHADLLHDERLAPASGTAPEGLAAGPVRPSPTTLAYSSWLVGQTSTAPYAVAAAAVLPCFTVYAEVGLALAEGAQAVPGHPYARWVAAYADPGFQASSAAAVDVVEGAVAADPASADAATEAAALATRFEWMFWDAASRREGWPRPEEA